MGKLIIKTIIFFVFVAVLDLMCGWSFDFLRSKARGGQTHKNEFIANECIDDILILGSSKADHHYVPCIIEDSLKMTCYNAGEMGCGILPAYVRYKMVCERKKPKLVIYEITPSYDYLADNGYSPYLGVFRQYTSNKQIKEIYTDFSDKLEGLRLLSKMYQNNSKLLINAKDLLTPPDKWKGYEPLYGKMNPDLLKGENNDGGLDIIIDTLKWSYLVRLINETKRDDVSLVFMMSPQFHSFRQKEFEPFIAFCKSNGIPVVNNQNCSLFSGQCDLFQDNTHLNHEGAVAYTKFVIPQIKEHLSKR